MRSSPTQEQLFFYKLYTEHKKEPERYVPAWEFVGEIFVPELNRWFLMSYKTPANGAAIFFKNPGLIERQNVRGKSGSKYFAYRIAPNPSAAKIQQENILEFYKKIAGK